MNFLSDGNLISLAGLFAGVILGFTARTVRFCSLSAIESALYGRDFQLMRLWGVAMAVSILITQSLHLYFGLELSDSIYLANDIPILALVVGGFTFGMGMSLVGTCGLGSILRFGGGDLRGLIAMLLIGIIGFVSMRGLFQPVKLALTNNLFIQLPANTSSGIPSLISYVIQPDSDNSITLIISVILSAALIYGAYSSPRYRQAKARQAGGIVVGCVIGFGWYVTGIMSQEGFNIQQPGSISYVAPTGETLMFLMHSTGLTLNFGITAVLGTLLGAFLASIKAKDFHWDSFDDPREMKRHIAGACLMGFGGVVVGGCTIGQGVTGISTLSISSFIAFAAIITGAGLGIKFLIDGNWDHIPFFR